MFHSAKSIEKLLYECQIGMYYTHIKKLRNGFVVYSDIVESTNWNFFTGFHAKDVKAFIKSLDEARKFFNLINRKFVFVIGPNVKISKMVKKYIQDNFTNFDTDVVLLTKKFKIKKLFFNNYSFRQIDNIKERDFFVNVFRTSKLQTTPTDVYPPLPEYFFKALYNSFDSKTDWSFNHFVSEYNNEPVGMVTACIKDKYCGLYGGGTYVEHRRKGVFTNLLKFVEKDAKSKGCKYFYGITEKGSYNEKLYNSINWKTKFELLFFEPKN